MLVGAMSGPLGGDHFTVEADVLKGARLRLGSAAATIALPGQTKGEARYDVRLTVADGGELHWLPEQLISAGGSDLCVTTRIDLGATSRLVLREEQVLGRAGRSPGGSAAGSCCASRDAPCSIRSWPAGPGRRAAGTGRPCSRDIELSVNFSSYDRSSPRSR